MSKFCKISIFLVLIILVSSTMAFAGITQRVSISSGGVQGNNESVNQSISEDGRFVAFRSTANNLVPGETNNHYDIFLYDRLTGIIKRVSISTDGVQANADSWVPSISSDGRFVAFFSAASNLVSGDTNGYADIFVHDNQAGITERVSVSSNGLQANGSSERQSISADGRFVAFGSYANNLVSDDTNNARDIFVHDRQTGLTQRVSISSDGVQANNSNQGFSISADGRFVAFGSDASNLVSGDTNNARDVFVHDRQNGITERVSVSSNGAQANNLSCKMDEWGGGAPSISADGRFIAFDSDADNLISSDTNGQTDVFVHDRQTNITERVSISSNGLQGNDDSDYPSLSGDGRFVAFASAANNLVGGDTNGQADIFVNDRQTDTTQRVSISSDGAQANNLSDYDSCISANGRFVTFQSLASNLVSGDTNSFWDIFVHDIEIPVIDISLNKTTIPINKGNSETLIATISPSDATNKDVTWESSNNAIATVDADGNVNAVGGGTCTITVTTIDGGFTATCQVNVNVPVTNVSLNKTTLSLNKTATETLVATINPSDATNKGVNWSSGNTSVATVDSSGKVTAIGTGNCTITVTTTDGSKTATCLVNVNVPVVNVTLDKTALYLEKASSEQLTATISPTDATNKDVTWSSSNTSVATVNSSGIASAVGTGNCTITVTTIDGGFTASCYINVQTTIYFTSPTMADSCDSFYKTINIYGKSDYSITKASWQIDAKRKGSCKISSGTWSGSKVGLVLGDNLITVTGISYNKQIYTDTLHVRYIDNIKPEVKISQKPTFSTTKAIVNISGSAKDLETIAKVSWINTTTGNSGVCTGTKSWKASGLALALGNNEITVSAEDSSGNIGTSKIVVTMIDKTKPKVVIVSPTDKSSLTLYEQNLALGGYSSDDIGLAKIEWLNKTTGAYGVCSGTTSWNSSIITLQIGKNSIIVTATDTSGNIATDTITVTRK